MTQQSDEELAAQAMAAGEYKEALVPLHRLSERNSEYGLLSLAWIYETGAGTPANLDAARACYEQAVACGSAAAYSGLGWLLIGIGQEQQAREVFRAGVQLGNPDCATALSSLHDKDLEKRAQSELKAGHFDAATALLGRLAERNSEYALLCLGSIHETGATGTSNLALARTFFRRAAALGRPLGNFEFGRFLMDQGDDPEARAHLRLAAEAGHVDGMFRLGKLLMDGRGGPEDIPSGTAWLEKAAAEGHRSAKRNLLALEQRQARTLTQKVASRMKLVALALEEAKADRKAAKERGRTD